MLRLGLIGLGPSNLSLAALATEYTDASQQISLYGFDSNQPFQRHANQNFPGTCMQSEFYRDLVTPVSPTSEFSSLNFLKEQGRLHRFISAGFLLVDRSEFQEYLHWVSARVVPQPQDACVEVDFDNARRVFVVKTKTKTFECDSVSVGMGREPHLPPGIRASDRILHVSDFSEGKLTENASICVVGSGQSASELILHLLSRKSSKQSISWVTGYRGFLGLDTNNFLREVYGPTFDTASPKLAAEVYRTVIACFSGAAPWTTEQLYQAIYRSERDNQKNVVDIRPFQRVEVVRETSRVSIETRGVDGREESFGADIVIFCTGFQWAGGRAFAVFTEIIKNNLKNQVYEGAYIASMSQDNHIMLAGLNGADYEGPGSGFISAPVRNIRLLDLLTNGNRFSDFSEDGYVRPFKPIE